jgi:hypothetical protein
MSAISRSSSRSSAGFGRGDERVRRGLDRFINVGVVESAALHRRRFARCAAFTKIRDAPGRFVLFQDVRNGDVAIGRQPRLPEPSSRVTDESGTAVMVDGTTGCAGERRDECYGQENAHRHHLDDPAADGQRQHGR